jgi:hypothetical protein
MVDGKNPHEKWFGYKEQDAAYDEKTLQKQ